MRTIDLKAVFVGLTLAGLAVGVDTGRSQEFQLLTFTNTWRYNQSGNDLGTAWKEVGYDDTVAGWEGPGLPLFGFETQPGEYPYAFNTMFPDPVTVTPYVNTYYF